MEAYEASDSVDEQIYLQLKEKQAEYMEEMEKLLHNCVKMRFSLASGKLELIYLWKTAEILKETTQKLADNLKRDN